MTLRAHPIPVVTTGIVALRGNDIAGFLRRHRDFLASSSDDIDLEAFAFAAPDEPMIFIKACYSGPVAGAEAALAPLRRLGNHVADDLAPRPYTGAIDPTGAVVPLFKPRPQQRRPDDVPGLHVGSVSMAPVDDEAARIIAERIARAEGGWIAGFAHYMHGAAARATVDQSPMPRIPGLLTTYFLSTWRRPEQAAATMHWVDDSVAVLRPHARPTYLNYLTDEEPEAVRAAYGPSYDRLKQVKRRYDPDNRFRRGRNIPST